MISLCPSSFMIGRPPCGLGSHTTPSTSAPVSFPFLPMKRLVLSNHRRSHPSSWLLVVLSTTGQAGQGVAGLSPTGGLGMISI